MAETDRPLDSLSDADLFRSAMTPQPAEPAAEPAPEPKPSPEPSSEPPPAPKPQEPPPQPPPQAAEAIPSWRLREEAEARRLAEDRARLLESRLNEVAAHLQQQQKPQNFLDDPARATEKLLVQYLQPYAEETRKQQMYNNKLLAGALHGADKVEAAETAFLEARANETLDPADYETVVQSPNRYDAVVRWHKKRSTLAAVGDDPAAWFEKQLEKSLADPKFQAKMLEKIQGSAAARQGETRLPPTLSRSTGVASTNGAGRQPGDGTESSLWSFATSERPSRPR